MEPVEITPLNGSSICSMEVVQGSGMVVVMAMQIATKAKTNVNKFASTQRNQVCLHTLICKTIIIFLEFLETCNLPKVAGPCEGYYPQWYYDKEQRQCLQFIYGGCLGNNNRFETREQCMGVCVKDSSIGKELEKTLVIFKKY